jgi:ATP-dependent helicase/nuclease subunit B
MSTAPAKLRRSFLGWERPLLPAAAEWLADGWSGKGPLDLTATLVIVPTRQAGRRLREALAEFAAAKQAAVFPPQVHTPDSWLVAGAEGSAVATKLEALLAWTEVLLGVDFAEFSAVLPVAPPRRDFAWAWRMAETFFRLQTQLGEAGLAFADVKTRAGAEFPEAARWEQLTLLEARQVERLAQGRRTEPHAARRAFARDPKLAEGISRIVLLAVVDPLPLAVEALERCAATIDVAAVVFAPSAQADAFDRWGRPVPELWTARPLDLPPLRPHVHVCADPAAEAAKAIELVARYAPEPDGLVALGSADPETLPLIENGLTRAGLGAYNPEGRPRRAERLHGLLSALAALAREASFEAVGALARCPDFLLSPGFRRATDASAARWLKELDALQAKHLPADLTAARTFAREGSMVAHGLSVIAEVRSALTRGSFPESAIAALGLLFRERRFDLAVEDDARLAESAAVWREILQEIARVRREYLQVKTVDWWDVALRTFGETRRTEEKTAGSLDLQGWLELLWEDAPHLIVTGCNDGLVPEAIVGDAFLPESLREKLGLKTNAARFARDAYLLQALASSRGAAAEVPRGRLDLILAKTSAVGDPLRPSRLLLRCDDRELPERVAWLFRPAEGARTSRAWTRAWQLEPRRQAPPMNVSVTALRQWLACPFRFYLGSVLRMEPVDPGKSELDARDFGTLCHAALEAMARAPELRDCTDEKLLREFLLARFDARARELYGEEHALPLVIQLESARQRLGKAAAVQARDRGEGWVIARAEWAFSLNLGGLEVRGKIDRVDRHESTGAWRVLDYKTSDTPVSPAKAHLRPLRAGEAVAPWMRLELNGRDYVWADLQLPLYVRALRLEEPGAHTCTCGYFNLPKAIGETAIEVWPELADELLASAQACAEGVAAAIRAGEFWPPRIVDEERDHFAALFHHGAEESVAWAVGGKGART